MNDLPTSASNAATAASDAGNNQLSNIPIVPASLADVQSSDSQGMITGGGIGKEKEIVGSATGLPLVDVGGIEMELPKEVSATGVRVHPTTVTIPPPVQQMGVTATGTNVPLGTGAAVTLPLTDDQIAQGLHQGMTSSWRWLAEWCIRRLKQLHVGISYVHGKFFRTRAS